MRFIPVRRPDWVRVSGGHQPNPMGRPEGEGNGKESGESFYIIDNFII
jgi:hypothetical protein